MFLHHPRPLLLLPTLVLVAACAAAPTPTSSPSPTPSASEALLTLSPVPLTLTVPLSLDENAWVAPLNGDYVDALAADAAVQVQYRTDGDGEPMAGNLFWFTIDRFTTVMASEEAPKGIEVGLADGHVLFVQPALDMPFDPATSDGKAYGALVERVRDFRWYAMSDPGLTLMRPCPVYDALPTVPVDGAMLRVITDHFTEQGVAPAHLIDASARVLDVQAYALGTHECANPDGGSAAYTGAVPEGATDAVMAHVGHKAYPATGATASFVTLARMPGIGWMVVSEGTGP